MKVLWTAKALEDYKFWEATDPKTRSAIDDLITDIKRDHFKGLGKPEPLKHALQGLWSRRINRNDRLVYRVSGKDDGKKLEIISCRYHY